MRRREFLRILGVVSSATLAPSCGSRKKPGHLVSYILPPEEGVVPGESSYRPSTCTECPAGCGLSVEMQYGRPIKLEGAPGHPISDGGLCVRGQASIDRLYHPERITDPLVREGGQHRKISWDEALSRVADALGTSREEGRRNVFLSRRTTGALSRLIGDVCDRLGVERLPEFEVFSRSPEKDANALLFGVKDIPLYRIEESDFLLSVGADLVETYVSPVSYTRMISKARERDGFLWYHVEPHVSLTGAAADRRFAIAPGGERHLLAFLLRETARKGTGGRLPRAVLDALPAASAESVSGATGIPAGEILEIGKRFAAARRPLLIFGGVSAARGGGLEAAALAGLVLQASGAVPKLVDFDGSENYRNVGTLGDMEALSARLGGGEIGTVILLRANPVFALPRRLAFRESLGKARLSVGLGDILDETLRATDLVLPLSHSLESWGELEPRRGVVSLLRPTIPPLHNTLSDGDALLRLMEKASGGGPRERYEERLLAGWERRFGASGKDRLLERGHIAAAPAKTAVSFDGGKAASLFRDAERAETPQKPLLVFAPSLRTFDGRSRPLPLLSEIPDPLTTISYGPWISVSPATAARLRLSDEDEVTVAAADWRVALPAKVQPGLPEDVFVLFRDAVAAPPLSTEPVTGTSVDVLEGVTISKTGKRVRLPILSGSFSQHGRGLAPEHDHRDEEHRHERRSLYPEHEHPDYRWGMAIDRSLCNGCSACVAACYVENNVAVVGKKEHLLGRELSWLRIEPFYNEKGDVAFLPMLCQHCDNAPCEPVCPVYAAYHNPEGLNVQVYNRCVGTRYCSNNCPYKVRRFNWFEPRWPNPLDTRLNPDVQARTVGVMEKCTFCIQRIRSAKDKARDEGRRVRDGEFTTACAQSCPTGAIVFGNLLDRESRVYKLAHSDRAYRVFEILGTEPAVHYLRGETPRHGA